MYENIDDILLLPHTVKEVMSQLVDKEIIPHSKIMTLKKDNYVYLDPNLVMDLRHNQIKERRKSICLKSNINDRGGENNTFKYKQDNAKDQVKEMKIIDDEIKKYEKNFEIENRKLKKMISDIKQSGKEITNRNRAHQKLKKQKDAADDDDCRDGLLTPEKVLQKSRKIDESKKLKKISSRTNNLNNKIVEDSKNYAKQDELKECSYGRHLHDLSKIKMFLDSMDNVDDDQKVMVAEKDCIFTGDSVEIEVQTSKKYHENVKHEPRNEENKLSKNKTMKRHKNRGNNMKIKMGADIINIPGKQIDNFAGNALEQETFNVDKSIQKWIQICEEIGTNDRENKVEYYNSKEFSEEAGKHEFIEDNVKIKERNLDSSPCRDTEKSKDTEVEQICNDDEDVVVSIDELTYTINRADRYANDRYVYLAKKYWAKWKHQMLVRCRNSDGLHSRNTVDLKFDFFLRKLQKHVKGRKSRDNTLEGEKKCVNTEPKEEKKLEKAVKYGEKFKNRFKAQKDIIERQKHILQEQSKKIQMLEEEESKIKKNPSENVVEKQKEMSDFKENPIPSKERTKRIENLLEVPKFVENMEKRAQERREKREQLNEIRKLKEEEKLRVKLQEEDDKKRKEEEKKYIELQAEQMEYLKKILQEEERKIEARNIQEAERRLVKLNRNILLNTYMALWKRAFTKRKEDLLLADEIYNRNLKTKMFNSLKNQVETSKKRKIDSANLFHRCKLQKKYWNIWYRKWKETEQLSQVAEDYDEMRLKRRVAIGLFWNREQNHRIEDELVLQAILFHKKKMLIKCLQSLKTFPHLMFEEREKEKRLRSWEDKIKEILPDFTIT